MRFKSFIAAAILLLVPMAQISAHSGGTNSSGCHTEHSTGTYHCHGGGGGGAFNGTSSSPKTTMPTCPEGQYYSLNKNKCVCPSAQEENAAGECVCKSGFTFTDDKKMCVRLPLAPTKSPNKVRPCKQGYVRQGAKCVKPKKSISSSASNATTSGTCVIKGNISSSKQKIFHVPGCPNYKQTVIDTSVGERLFCTEAEAKAAGWRKALNCP